VTHQGTLWHALHKPPFHYTKLYHITSHNGNMETLLHFDQRTLFGGDRATEAHLVEGRGGAMFVVAPLHVCMCMWLRVCLHVHVL